ncbi:hypothetical protein Poly30_33240 [Planctomycetes bacterium Poly30]|uniref:Glycosyltransferase RgtA/B/C/D-like domain-containing protein n=1 Tax=Saltatorellus ferox TaxID=2528018 RepID=A0A518EUP9_9BACT|nr:hypothetical protein Poly30_33240 [Planctomycetes bacterium Poly30]
MSALPDHRPPSDAAAASSGEVSSPGESKSTGPGVGSSGPGWLRLLWRTAFALTFLWLGVVFVFPESGPGAAGRVGAPAAWGWDETMHAELPAVQMLLHARNGSWFEVMEVLHECDRYPFVYPVFLSLWQGVLGIGQATARSLGYVFYFLLVLLSMRLGLQAVRKGTDRGPRVDTVLLVGLAAISGPLARRYAPTLFLEVPTLVMMALSLTAWISRRYRALGTGAPQAGARARIDLLTGLLIAATFFTKFNYALLLGLALFLDALVDLVVSRDRRAEIVSLARTGVPLAIGLVWWFLLPLPLGAEVAAEHRGDFMEFVTGNTEMEPMQPWFRRLFWIAGIAAHPILYVALCLSAAAFLVLHRTRTSLTLGIALVAFVVPVATHEFLLDRFLLPAALVLWVLGGAGAALALRRAPRVFTAVALPLFVASAAIPAFKTTPLIGLPVAEEGSTLRGIQEFYVGKTISLFGPPASNGLPRGVHDEIMDLIADGVGPVDSVGWLGQSAEISPADLHLSLLERGGSKERFLEYAEGPMDIVLLPSNVRVDFTQEELLEYARQFDHVVVPAEGDLVGRAGRAWIPEAWYAPLRASSATEWKTLGSVLIERSNEGPWPVTLELMHVEVDE